MRVMGIASAAIQHQTRRLEASAERLNKVSVPPKDGEEPPDIAKEATVRIEAGALTKANLAVIKSEDERLKHLLDVLA